VQESVWRSGRSVSWKARRKISYSIQKKNFEDLKKQMEESAKITPVIKSNANEKLQSSEVR
jgi:hypothetical protein